MKIEIFESGRHKSSRKVMTMDMVKKKYWLVNILLFPLFQVTAKLEKYLRKLNKFDKVVLGYKKMPHKVAFFADIW